MEHAASSAARTPLLAHGVAIAFALSCAACSDDKPKAATPAQKSSGGELVSKVRSDTDEADRTLQKETKPAGDWLDDKSRDVQSGVSKAADDVEGTFHGDDNKRDDSHKGGKDPKAEPVAKPAQ